jgi:tyrosinase
MPTTKAPKRMSHNGHTQPMMEMHPVSFAEFFRDREAIQRTRLKFPDWLFIRLNERKDQASLTTTEQERFLCALTVLIQNGTFGQLVAIHADMSHQMHGNPRFLPWHRVYLLQLEQALQAIHPDVTLPYWDWTQAAEQGIPPWLQGFMPTVMTPAQTITVSRAAGSPGDLGLIASNTPNVLQLTAFADFAPQLESIHNGVHVWVGGSMSMIATAPADPLFWMHHANIDRLWWQWQSSPQGQGKNPNLSGAAAVMDPWPVTEAATRDIVAMGYTYI